MTSSMILNDKIYRKCEKLREKAPIFWLIHTAAAIYAAATIHIATTLEMRIYDKHNQQQILSTQNLNSTAMDYSTLKTSAQ